MARFLGLDASTQSLSGLIIDMDTGTVSANHSVVFGERLLHFHSPKGFLLHEDPRVKHSDPLMWVEALELLLGDLVKAGVDLMRSGAAVERAPTCRSNTDQCTLARSFDTVGAWSTDRAVARSGPRPP